MPRCSLRFIAACLVLSCAPAAGAAGDAEAASYQRYVSDVRPLLAKYCGKCHNSQKKEAELALDGFRDQATVLAGTKVWEKVSDKLHTGEMPPEDKPRPTPAELAKLKAWVDGQLASNSGPRDPGRVTIRRLNRAEYNNTIRDLLAVDFKPADDFPSDDVGEGFDNIGDVLSMPPILMEKYLAAAEKITSLAIWTDPPRLPTKVLQGSTLAGGEQYGKRSRILSTNGEVSGEFDLPRSGEFLLKIRAFGQQAGDELPKMVIQFDGKVLKTVHVNALESKSETFTHKLQLEAGKRKVVLAFTNDYYNPDDPNPERRDRNLIIRGIELEGPYGVDTREFPESHQRIFSVTPRADGSDKAECARKIVRNIANHAFRRPLETAEIDRLLRFYERSQKEGDTFEQSIQYTLQAVLVSPSFLFRVELDNGAAARRLNDFELASRLSYFLWSSMPDDELFGLAAQNKLHEPKTLRGQVARMVKSAKSRAMVDNFAGQWLQIRNLNNVAPAKTLFPNFDDNLRQAMRTETELFFEHVMRENASILDFIDGNYTFINERLAQHYGIPNVTGDNFRRVMLPDDRRGGILTQGSILTITSNPTRTSPVKRGKWVLENLLGAPPPPPPPNVPELSNDKDKVLTGSLRTRMEQHRANVACAACHARMDPIGFGFENFDAVGRWRTKDGNFDIEPAGTLPNGKSFQGPAELRVILKSNKDAFTRCLCEKMLTFALGRGLTRADRPYVEDIMTGVAKDDYKFSSVLFGVVESDPFQMRGKRGTP